jgi:hypothetical protein
MGVYLNSVGGRSLRETTKLASSPSLHVEKHWQEFSPTIGIVTCTPQRESQSRAWPTTALSALTFTKK